MSSLSGTHGRLPRLGLMRLFAVAGAAAIGALMVAMAMLLGWFIEGRMLERDAAVSRDLAQSIAKVQQVATVVNQAQIAPAATDPKFAEFIAHMAAMPDVLRVNVYGADRKVLWFSRPEMVGRTFGTNDELDEALRAGGGRLGTQGDCGGRALPAPRRAVCRHPQRPAAGDDGAAVGGAFLFLCLIGFVWHAEQRRQLVEADALAIVGEISAGARPPVPEPSLMTHVVLMAAGGPAAGCRAPPDRWGRGPASPPTADGARNRAGADPR